MYSKNKSTCLAADAQANEKLAMYVHEYLIHNGATKAASTFLQEIRWDKPPNICEAPGFLSSWWGIFWDLYSAAPERRDTHEHTAEAKAFHDYGFVNSGYPNGLPHPGHPMSGPNSGPGMPPPLPQLGPPIGGPGGGDPQSIQQQMQRQRPCPPNAVGMLPPGAGMPPNAGGGPIRFHPSAYPGGGGGGMIPHSGGGMMPAGPSHGGLVPPQHSAAAMLQAMPPGPPHSRPRYLGPPMMSGAAMGQPPQQQQPQMKPEAHVSNPSQTLNCAISSSGGPGSVGGGPGGLVQSPGGGGGHPGTPTPQQQPHMNQPHMTSPGPMNSGNQPPLDHIGPPGIPGGMVGPGHPRHLTPPHYGGPQQQTPPTSSIVVDYPPNRGRGPSPHLGPAAFNNNPDFPVCSGPPGMMSNSDAQLGMLNGNTNGPPRSGGGNIMPPPDYNAPDLKASPIHHSQSLNDSSVTGGPPQLIQSEYSGGGGGTPTGGPNNNNGGDPASTSIGMMMPPPSHQQQGGMQSHMGLGGPPQQQQQGQQPPQFGSGPSTSTQSPIPPGPGSIQFPPEYPYG